jgi:hypothetical protein
MKVAAVIGPNPGTVITRQTSGCFSASCLIRSRGHNANKKFGLFNPLKTKQQKMTKNYATNHTSSFSVTQ